jgi:hypothetical protein
MSKAGIPAQNEKEIVLGMWWECGMLGGLLNGKSRRSLDRLDL